jgi:hypothetical protein
MPTARPARIIGYAGRPKEFYLVLVRNADDYRLLLRPVVDGAQHLLPAMTDPPGMPLAVAVFQQLPIEIRKDAYGAFERGKHYDLSDGLVRGVLARILRGVRGGQLVLAGKYLPVRINSRPDAFALDDLSGWVFDIITDQAALAHAPTTPITYAVRVYVARKWTDLQRKTPADDSAARRAYALFRAAKTQSDKPPRKSTSTRKNRPERAREMIEAWLRAQKITSEMVSSMKRDARGNLMKRLADSAAAKAEFPNASIKTKQRYLIAALNAAIKTGNLHV